MSGSVRVREVIKMPVERLVFRFSLQSLAFFVTSITFLNNVLYSNPLEVNCQWTIFSTAYIKLKFIDLFINNQPHSTEIIFD